MPWKESDAMSERMKFVIRLEEGERLTDLCKEFQISRKTGYKIWSRYKECGVDAFVDRSRRPIRIANETDSKIQKLILDLKEDKPTWGAPKILEYLKRRYSE
jgi:transposase